MLRPPPLSTLFPYTTLFRSALAVFSVIFCLIAPPMQFLGVAFPWILDEQRSSRRLGTLYALNTVGDRKSTRLNSSHVEISYAVFCLKKKKISAGMDVARLNF